MNCLVNLGLVDSPHNITFSASFLEVRFLNCEELSRIKSLSMGNCESLESSPVDLTPLNSFVYSLPSHHTCWSRSSQSSRAWSFFKPACFITEKNI